MQELIYTALVPHPPLLIPAVGGSDADVVRSTRSAMETVAAEVAGLHPDAVVIISPHGPVFQDAIAVHMMSPLKGNLQAFGAPQVALDVSGARDLGNLVLNAARDAGLPAVAVTPERASTWEAEELDHGTLVPLWFLHQAGWRGPVLPITAGGLPQLQLYAFGQALQGAIDRYGQRVAVLASGDLSHRLTPDAPEGYSPDGAAFDREVVETLGRGDLAHLFALDAERRERAASCAIRPLLILTGALDGMSVKSQVLSYEGPFGVGYAVVPLYPGAPTESRRLLPAVTEARAVVAQRRRDAAHPVVTMARTALEHFVHTGLTLDFSAGAPHEGTAAWELPADLPDRAGVFVTLTVDGDLRGCMGTFHPTEASLELEIVRNAIMAGTEDPRFPPVEEAELTELEYAVSVLDEPEPCHATELDPAHYGVIVTARSHRALLLPDLPGLETVEAQLAAACRKGGINRSDPALRIQRFRTRRFV